MRTYVIIMEERGVSKNLNEVLKPLGLLKLPEVAHKQ